MKPYEQALYNTLLYWFSFIVNSNSGIKVLSIEEMKQWAETFNKDEFLEKLERIEQIEKSITR